MYYFLRYLTLSTTFNQLGLEVSSRHITFMSDAYIQAINGATFDGNLACYLSSGAQVEVNTPYNVLTDFQNCSTVSGGFSVSALSTTVGLSQLYFYFGTNGPCSTLYGPLAAPATEGSSLSRDASSVGGAVYSRVGDPGCLLGTECHAISLTPGSCDSQVGQNAEVSIALFNFFVTDQDGLTNSDFTYSIIGGALRDSFDINPDSGILTLVRSLNRESNAIVNLQGSVSDGLFSGNFSIQITVLDVNDNNPEPTEATFVASLREGLPNDSFVIAATFQDRDEGDNARLTYSIVSSNFAILDSSVPDIYTSREFDYENGDRSFLFTITAEDSGSIPRTGQANISVTILDVNDNRPSLQLTSGRPFIEDFDPVVPATVVVSDADSDAYPILFAIVSITNPLNGNLERLSLPNLPTGYRLGYFNNTLFIVGAGTPDDYSLLLGRILYENSAPTFELPLERSLSYGVCDMLALNPSSMLSAETQLALTSAATTSDLPAQDAVVLETGCVELSSATISISLVETNDRPTVVSDVTFPEQLEDLLIEENRGSYVSRLFANAVSDDDRNSITGIAVIENGNGAASPERGVVGSNLECRNAYDQIARIENGCSDNQLNATDFCECLPPRSLTCISSPNEIVFFCVDGMNVRACTCAGLSPPNPSLLPEFSEISSIVLKYSSEDTGFNLPVLTPGTADFTIANLNDLFRFTMSFSTLNVTLHNGPSMTSEIPPFSIEYEPIGSVEQQSAIVLGPFDLIRWVSLPNVNGNASFTFKGWDTTNGVIPGTRGVNTSQSVDTSFSLDRGQALITITPVNDPPIILINGSQANDSVEYTEGVAVHVARSPTVLDYDDLMLSDLTVRIYPEGGSCDLPNFSGQSNDVLIHAATASLSLTIGEERMGQACVNYNFRGSMSVSNWQSFIMSLRFNATEDEPSDHTRVLEFVINDSASSSTPVFTTVTVVLVSDTCPLLSLDSSNPVTYRENGPPVRISSLLNVTDGDRNSAIRSATVQIMQTPNVQCAQCSLNVSSTPQIQVSFNQALKMLTLVGTATPMDYQNILRRVVFVDDGEEPTFSLVTVRFTVQDPVLRSCDGVVADVGVMVEHVNDVSPVLYLDYPISQDFNQTFTEGVDTVLVSSSVTILDNDGLDSPTYHVRVSISSECYPMEDRLEFSSVVSSSLLFGYNFSSCSLELEGNLTNLVEDISRLRYRNLNVDNPTPSTRVIEFVISDEFLPPATSSTLLSVVSINDAPNMDLNVSDSFSPNVTRQFEDTFVRITSDGLVSEPEGDMVQLMTFILTEVDSTGNIVPRSDIIYEELEVSTSILNMYNLSGSYFAQTGELLVTGSATDAAYTEVLNNCFYRNRRFPVTDNNVRQVTVTSTDGFLRSTAVASTILFRVSRNAPMLDLDSTSVGINVEAEYRSTNSPSTLFPNAVLIDMDRDNICRLELTLSGDTCPNSQIGFSNSYPDISLNTSTSTTNAVVYILTTRFTDCREGIVFQDVVRGVAFSNMNQESSGTCSLTVVAIDDQMVQSIPATATITVRAFNVAPFIDLDVGLSGRDYSTVYFQGGNLQHIVSIYNASTARNITDVTAVGEAAAAGEAPVLGATEIGSYDDGTIYHGVVINEQSNAGFVVIDTDSPTLDYLQVEFFSGAHLEQDAIAYPCVTTAPLPPYGCASSDSTPTTFSTPTCNSSVFDSCHIQDLCTDLQVSIFCPSPGRKAYRFSYVQNPSVRRYEVLLGLLGYDFLPRTGGQINQMRLLNITVFDPLSSSVNPLAITRIRIRSQENLIILTDPPSFDVYEDERPRRTCNLYQIALRRLDGTVPSPSEVIYNISQGNIGDAFGVTDEGIIFLNNRVDREAIDSYNLTISVRLRIADPDTTSSAFLIANVVDVNDNPPVTQDFYNVNVTEMMVNETVVQLNVTDRDEGLNAEFNYFVLGIGESNFAVDQNGRIYTTVPLNRSVEDYYLLVVVIYDRGMIPLATHTVVNVMVVTPPATQIQFTSPSEYDVLENALNGSIILPPLAAREVGTDDIEFIRYRFNSIISDQGSMERPFEVNEDTGTITVVGSLDSERTQSYIAFAEAYSTRTLFPPMSGFINITFNIRDNNEHPPVFARPVYELSIPENTPISTTLITFSATDGDIDNQAFNFSLSPQSISGVFPFRVDLNGDLVVNDTVDYELRDVYIFEVLVTDSPPAGMVPMQGSATVTITVQDRNDNPPQFIGTPYSSSVLETEPNGTIILNIDSSDRDSFINNAVFYSANGLEGTPLCLYENHTFIEVCDSELLTSIEMENVVYNITIIATNPAPSGNQVSMTPAQISIVLVNELPPVLSTPVISLNITEEHCGRGRDNNCNGFILYDISTITSDGDGGRGGELNYRLMTPSVPFAVDLQSGVLTVNGTIDRERDDAYTLDIEISDGGDDANMIRSTRATVNILVEDIDDNPPVILEPCTFNVPEAITQSGAVFGQVNITDADIVGTHFFRIMTFTDPPISQGCILVSGPDYLPVQLDVNTGNYFFCRPVDFETEIRSFTFQVLVLDRAPSPDNTQYRVLKEVIVNVVDSNDNPPVLSQPNYDFSIPENQPNGTIVGSVSATDLDSGDNALLQFLVVGGSNMTFCNSSLPFYTIKTNATTANIVQCEALDYENQTFYDFLVQVSDSGTTSTFSDTSSVSVTVQDRNDNPPIFSQDIYFMTIAETDFSLGMDPVVTVSISDADSLPNSIATFRIVSPVGIFGLRSETSSSAEVFVSNPGMIDFESGVTRYEVIVEARNAVPGDVTQLGMAQVNVTVMDINDNVPMILPPFVYAVRENQPLGTSVGIVRARDADTAVGTTLRFFTGSMSEDQTCSSSSNFIINTTSGEITTCRSLDYENQTMYSVLVVVCDSIDAPMCSNRSIAINVLDLNDNSPIFSEDPYIVNLNELSDTGTLVGSVSSTDLDGAANSNVTYSLPNMDIPFSITGSAIFFSGTSSELDYERGNRTYAINVLAQNPPAFQDDVTQTSTVAFVINLIDRNDNPPVFPAPVQSIAINEHTTNNQIVFSLTTTDEDSLANSAVSYTILSTNVPFVIDGSNIIVQDSNAIDYDPPNNIRTYTLSVRATNPPASPDDQTHTADFTLTVNINDINDNVPVCIGITSFRLPEDVMINVDLVEINAQDIDSGVNGNVLFLPYNTGMADPLCSDDNLFSIDPDSGAISICQGIDYETRINYSVNFTICDMGMPRLCSICPVSVSVTDVNDNSPVILQPTEFTVSENVSIGYTVGCVNATDADSLQNAQLEYNFGEGVSDCSFNTPFNINDTSGCIFVCFELNYETRQNYTFLVNVSDMGNPRLSSDAFFIVRVQNENDHPPVITSPNTASIQEESDNQEVIRVISQDIDLPPFNVPTFRLLVDDGGRFSIDRVTGSIDNLVALDREEQAEHILVVEVSDGRNVVNQTITVSLTDINDNPPEYLGPADFVFMENFFFSTMLIFRDNDTGENALLVYEVDDSNFEINSNGVLRNTVELDRDPDTSGNPQLTIFVTARDNTSSPLSLTVSLNVTLEDVNDNNPALITPITDDIIDGTRAGQVVFTVRATDADEGVNAALTYFLGFPSDTFEVIADTGEIRLIRDIFISTDSPEVLLVTVNVSDAGFPTRSDSVQGRFFIVSSFPLFSPNMYNFSIEENSLGVIIGNVSAMDRDINPFNDMFLFTIISVSPYNPGFSLESIDTTGSLFSPLGYLDYEDSRVFQLSIGVGRFNTSGVVDDMANITLTIIGTNDNVPRLSPVNISAEVPENSGVGTSVAKVVAIDFDAGESGRVSYNLSGIGADSFDITAQGDLVITQAVLDFEQRSMYTLEYQACDNGMESQCSEVGFISVRVTDVDDIPPVFSPTIYVTEIPEGYGSVRLVLYVNITDGDTSLEDLTVSLDPPQSSFQVMVGGPNVLAISTTSIPLDRETQSRYVFSVIARDPSGAQATASVTLLITDVNDERPRVVPSQSIVQFQEGGSLVYPASGLDIVDGDTIATFPLSRVSVSLQSNSESTSDYPNVGGMCDHANYSILYQNNVHYLCGQDNCLYLLQEDELILFGTGATLIDGILSLSAGNNFARNPAIFVGEMFQNFTITVWVRFPNSPSAGNIYEVQSGNTNVFELHITTTGALSIRIRTSLTTFSELLVSNSLTIQDGRWHQISFIRGRSSLSLYLDGVSVGSTEDRGDIRTGFSSGSFFLGFTLENVEISELYFCSLVALSRSDILCSLTCGEYIDVVGPTPDVSVTIDQRTRSVEMVYVGTDPAASLSSLVDALRNVTYFNILDEPHPLDRALFITASDEEGSATPAIVSLQPILVNDRTPVIDLNGTVNAGLNYFTSSNESSPTTSIIGPDALLYDSDSGWFPLESIALELENPQRSHRLIVPSDLPPGLIATFTNEERILFIEAPNRSHPVFPDTFLDVLRQVQYSNLLEEQNQFVVSVLYRITDFVNLVNNPLSRTFITVLPTNDPPQLNLASGNQNSTVIFDEGQGVVNLLSEVRIEDSDSTILREATVSFTFRPDGLDESLRLEPGSLPVVDSNSVRFDSVLGVLTISHVATFNDWISILQNIQYLNSNQDPSVQSRRQVVVVVQDNGGAYSNSAYVDIEIILENDPPILYLGGPGIRTYTAMFTEDGPCVPLVSPDAEIAEPDSTGIQLLVISVPPTPGNTQSIVYNGTNDQLNIFMFLEGNLAVAAPPDDTAGFTSVLRNLVYCNTEDEPSNAPQTINYFISDNGLADGRGGFISRRQSTATSTVTITNVNDQPVVTFTQLDDISIRDIPTAIINSSSIVIDDSDDMLFDTLNIFITNPQDGSDDELIQFAAQLPSSSISRGPFDRPDGQILYTVTFTGGADVNRVTETISQLRYNNRADVLTPEPPRIICVQLRDFKIFSELSCVNVTISPPNIHSPGFLAGDRAFTFSEINNYTTIGVFVATDSDTGREGSVMYRIENVMSTGTTGTVFTIDIFTVNPTTGELAAPNGLDAEGYTSHTITLLALDQGNPVRSDRIIVTVTVNDINDEAPVFVGAPYVAPNLREDLAPPNNVIQVVAMDGDVSPANTQNIQYSLLNFQDRFVIDSVTGVIQSVVTFDAEEQQVYVLNVSASDSGIPPLVSYTTVTLTLIDTNDNTALVDQLTPAIYVANRGSSSIGPAARITDLDLSPPAVTFIQVSFVPSSVDSGRTYDQCLTRCQDVRLDEAGLTDRIDLLNIAVLQGTASRTTIGAGSCPAVRFVKSNDVRVSITNDGYARIPRNDLPANFASGQFSLSFVITQEAEGYIVLIPSTAVSPPDGIGSIADRQFGVWVRRRDVRLYYRIAADSELRVAVVNTGVLFFDRDNVETKHYTIVVTSTEYLVYVNCVFIGRASLIGNIVPVSPGVDVFLGSSRPHPSATGGRLGGDEHGLFYHPVALTADQITSFCSCGFEALQLPTLPSNILSSLDNANTRITLTSSPPGGIIPATEVSSILRSVNYTNQFDSPDLSRRPLTYLVREANDQEGTSFGSIQLVLSDDSRPTVTLSSASIDTSASYVEDQPPTLISPQASINRPAVVTPTFDRVVVTLENAIDSEEMLNATGTEFISVMASNNQQTLEIVGPSVPGEFNNVLRSITYSNFNDNPNSSVNRRVTFLAFDTEGRTNEVLAVSTISLQAVNDPPEISLSSVTSYQIDVVQFQEGTSGVLLAPNISVSDVDSATLQSATLVLTSPAPESDMLAIPSVSIPSVTVTYNPSDGTLSLIGPASLGDYQRLLSSVQFVSSDSPFLDSSVESLMRSVTIQVSDGQLSSASATVQVQFVPNNDAPIIMLDPADVIFRDNDVRVLIAPTGNISDSDNRRLASMTVELQDILDNNVLTSGTQISRTLQFGENSVSDMVSLLRSIHYVNMAAEPTLVQRVITVTVCDFMLCSNLSRIIVQIVDVNDNPPVFSSATYEFTTREDSGVDTTVGTLHVSDSDNSATTFTFSTETQQFSLRQELSAVHILVNTSLDFETRRTYQFNVIASDGINNASALVSVLVSDVNEPPLLTFNPPQPSIVVSSASRNRLIQVPLIIEDPDENDITPIVTLSLMNVPEGSTESLAWNENAVQGYSFQLLEAGGSTYLLSGPGDSASLTQALNEVMYVAGTQITDPTTIRSVAIVLYDSSNATSPQVQVSVSLASIPQFSEGIYDISQQEEQIVNNFLQVQATVESGGNVIVYSVEQGRGISIDPSTGFLSLEQALDRELTPVVMFNVFATDELPPARTGTATVRITVLDINDVRPTLSNISNITLSTAVPVMPFSSIIVEDPDTTGAIENATVSITGQQQLTMSAFTGRVCVDESDLIVKMSSVCGGLTEGIVLLDQVLPSSTSVPASSVNVNSVLTLSGSNYAIVDAATSSFAGTLSEFTFVAWLQPASSGYILYYGTRDAIERYFVLFYNSMRNQLIVTLKREGMSGLSAQIRISFQLDEPLNDGMYHFVMLQYIDRSLTCVVDGVQASRLAVVYKSQMFVNQAFGKSFHYCICILSSAFCFYIQDFLFFMTLKEE